MNCKTTSRIKSAISSVFGLAGILGLGMLTGTPAKADPAKWQLYVVSPELNWEDGHASATGSGVSGYVGSIMTGSNTLHGLAMAYSISPGLSSGSATAEAGYQGSVSYYVDWSDSMVQIDRGFNLTVVRLGSAINTAQGDSATPTSTSTSARVFGTNLTAAYAPRTNLSDINSPPPTAYSVPDPDPMEPGYYLYPRHGVSTSGRRAFAINIGTACEAVESYDIIVYTNISYTAHAAERYGSPGVENVYHHTGVNPDAQTSASGNDLAASIAGTIETVFVSQ